MKRLLLCLALLFARPAFAATNFLESAGTNGFIATPFSLMTTELNTLTYGSAVTSSVNGTSGVFSQSSGGSSIWCSIWLKLGGNFAATPAVGGVIEGWFLRSSDGGTTFESAVATASSTVAALPRAPDFILPASAATYASGNLIWAAGDYVKLPWTSYKVIIQNLLGTSASTASSGNILTCGPTAIQY